GRRYVRLGRLPPPVLVTTGHSLWPLHASHSTGDRLGGPLTLASESPLRRALYRALHDPLTGLANRGLLMEQLGQALARARRRPGAVAVLFLDLDRFKVVNDSLGHATGDDLL